MRPSCLLLATLLLSACGGDDDRAAPDAAPGPDARVPDAELPPDANPNMPATLAESGLYSDFAGEVLAADVHAYAPRFHLWSDGATKRRWIYLPPGATIDTTDMDFWQFPEGTKLWKEFTRDGVRVETRLIQKIGPAVGDWFYAAYAWNAEQTEAVAVPGGADNVLGTDHDIPSRSDCRKCHDRVTSRVLGFQAIALDQPAIDGQINLGAAMTRGWLSTLPPGTGNGDSYPLPGSSVAQAALGYLHTNCGNCHNASSDVHNNYPVEWRLTVATLDSVNSTPAWTTAVGVVSVLDAPTALIQPGSPDASMAYRRFTSTSPALEMPPIGREVIDPAGRQALQAWILSMGK